MLAIIDYGVGNLFSLKSSLNYIGEKAEITRDIDVIARADRLILPGVGAFRDAADALKNTGMYDAVIQETAKCKPLLGICLGMQMLFDKSYEYGEHDGLSLIPGKVVPLSPVIGDKLKVPHIGWNALIFPKDKPKSKLYKYVNEGEHVYFVHSFYASDCDGYVSASTEYGALITASAENKNVYGAQFHPEKSGDTGLNILRAFCEI